MALLLTSHVSLLVTFRRTHFELLFSNIVNECFKRGPTGVDQLRTTLEWRNKCEEMYARAKEEHVPLVHWTGWIKAKVSRLSIDPSKKMLGLNRRYLTNSYEYCL